MMTVDEIMSVDPVALSPTASLAEAEKQMQENRIRHIPVVDDDGELIGLVTQRDILASRHASPETVELASVMRSKMYTVPVSTEMRTAALLMQKFKIGSLPVTEEGKLVGIVTDSDYVALAINLLEQLDEAEPDDSWEFGEDTSRLDEDDLS